MHHEVRLDLRDARIVGQVGDVLRLLDVLAVVGRQARDRALELADRREVFVQAMAIRLSQRRLQIAQVLADRVEDALLAPTQL